MTDECVFCSLLLSFVRGWEMNKGNGQNEAEGAGECHRLATTWAANVFMVSREEECFTCRTGERSFDALGWHR
jgi:hypothetical protein